MRLVIARCQVDYVGRLTAHLPMATRLILVKADGSVSVHADDRAYKPLNWMSPPCTMQVSDPEPEVAEHGVTQVWQVRSKDGDTLRILLADVMHDSDHELGIDPGLQKDGVEADIEFHRSIAEATNNPHFMALVKFLFSFLIKATKITRSYEATKATLSPRSIVRLALRKTTWSPYVLPTPSIMTG